MAFLHLSYRGTLNHARKMPCSSSLDSLVLVQVSIYGSVGFNNELRCPKKPELVCQLLGPILRSKYPAISADEQAVSVPLQLLCLAIFDAILIYILNTVAPATWEDVRQNLSAALIHSKVRGLEEETEEPPAPKRLKSHRHYPGPLQPA